MVGLFDRFKNTERYSNYPDIAREPTARLPYALFGPTVVAHFPLYYKSHEDDNFERRATTLQEYVLKEADSNLRLDDKLTSKIIEDIYGRLHNLRGIDKPSLSDLQQAAYFVWYACRIGFACAVNSQPELFIFNANTRIKLEINRFAHRAVIKAIITQNLTFEEVFGGDSTIPVGYKPKDAEPNLNVWHGSHNLRLQAFWVTNCTIFRFTNELIGASTLLAASPNPQLPFIEPDRLPFLQSFQKTRPINLRTTPGFRPQERLGGLISWFDATTKREESIVDTALTNRKLFPRGPLKWRDKVRKIDPAYDDYLMWRRGDTNWRYTFFDGCYEYPDDGVDKLEKFLNKLLGSHALANSFPELKLNPEFEGVFNKYPFPGSRIAGAMYYVIPAELLVVIAAHFSDLSKRHASDSRKPHETGVYAHHRSISDRTFLKCLDVLDHLENLMWSAAPPFPQPPLKPKLTKPSQGFATYVTITGGGTTDQQILNSAKGVGRRIASLYDWISYGIKLEASEAIELQERFYGCFVDMAEIFWKCVYTSQTHSLGEDDFVCSSVIDGRAIYFSNFRPFETDQAVGSLGFTRTLFVDFRLTPYQRGRLVRRLCDVATFRMSCVKDIDRLHALSDGISQLNEDFNLLVSKSSNLGTSRNEAQISEALSDALVLYQRTLEFNMFITEGVSGRKSAALGDWVVVKKQITDIRESRLPSHAQLGDFLERGLGLSILEIEQIADRYENLIHRISSHMSTIQTELVGVHTSNLAQVMNNFEDLLRETGRQSRQQTSILGEAETLLRETQNLSMRQIGLLDKQTEFLDRQTELLNAADLLVWLGGTYYIWMLVQDIANKALDDIGNVFGYERLSDSVFSKIGLILVILGIVFVLVYWFKQKLRNFAQWTKKLAKKIFPRR
jgi:hypothetical protein